MNATLDHDVGSKVTNSTLKKQRHMKKRTKQKKKEKAKNKKSQHGKQRNERTAVQHSTNSVPLHPRRLSIPSPFNPPPPSFTRIPNLHPSVQGDLNAAVSNGIGDPGQIQRVRSSGTGGPSGGWCGVRRSGLEWCDVVWCGVVCFGVMWSGVLWCGVVWRVGMRGVAAPVGWRRHAAVTGNHHPAERQQHNAGSGVSE